MRLSYQEHVTHWQFKLGWQCIKSWEEAITWIDIHCGFVTFIICWERSAA